MKRKNLGDLFSAYKNLVATIDEKFSPKTLVLMESSLLK